jgi:hypothetical protein
MTEGGIWVAAATDQLSVVNMLGWLAAVLLLEAVVGLVLPAAEAMLAFMSQSVGMFGRTFW